LRGHHFPRVHGVGHPDFCPSCRNSCQYLDSPVKGCCKAQWIIETIARRTEALAEGWDAIQNESGAPLGSNSIRRPRHKPSLPNRFSPHLRRCLILRWVGVSNTSTPNCTGGQLLPVHIRRANRLRCSSSCGLEALHAMDQPSSAPSRLGEYLRALLLLWKLPRSHTDGLDVAYHPPAHICCWLHLLGVRARVSPHEA
jgi:hypothetical protein